MSDGTVEQLRDALLGAIEAAIALEAQPIQHNYVVHWWEPYSDHGATERWESRCFDDFKQVTDILSRNPSMDRLRNVASEIRKYKTPPFVIDETAEVILLVYFNRVKSVCVNDEILNEVVRQFVNETTTDNYLHRTILQISQFDAPEAFRLNDNIVFRPIKNDDLEAYAREPVPIRNRPRLNKRDWLCIIDRSLSEYEIDDSRAVMDRILGSLGLTADGRAKYSILLEGPVSPFRGIRYFGSEYWSHSSPIGNAISLKPEDVVRFQEVYKRVNEICDGKEKNRFVAFRRFRAAAERTEADDKLIDLVIALESLLVPNSSTESGYRFRIRGAAFLPDVLGNVASRIDLMKGLYEARSKLVHGSHSEVKDKHLLMDRATLVLRLVFLRLLPARPTIEDAIRQLDEALSAAGCDWLREVPSKGE